MMVTETVMDWVMGWDLGKGLARAMVTDKEMDMGANSDRVVDLAKDKY